MSQNDCTCEPESLKVPVLGLKLALDKEVLNGIGSGGASPARKFRQ